METVGADQEVGPSLPAVRKGGSLRTGEPFAFAGEVPYITGRIVPGGRRFWPATCNERRML